MRHTFHARRFHARRSSRIPSLLLLLLAVVPAAAACGSSAARLSTVGGAIPAASGAPAPPEDLSGSGDGAVPGASSGVGSGGGAGGDLAPVDATKIVRTGSLQVTVPDVDQALARARTTVQGFGGYIGASQQARQGDTIVATVTYRIPVDRWEDALDALRGLGTVENEKTDALEVTGQLVDLAARIRNLRASETALVGYATNAPKVADLLEIEARLTSTRGEIERLTAQQAQLQDQVALATLTVTFGTEPVAVKETADRWDPGAEVDRATATLISVGQAVVSVAIVFAIVWLPMLVVIGLVALVAVAVARRVGWRRSGGYPPIAPPQAPVEP